MRGILYNYNHGPTKHFICISETPGELLLSEPEGDYQWYAKEDVTKIGIADIHLVRMLIDVYNSNHKDQLEKFYERRFPTRFRGTSEFAKAGIYAEYLIDQADQGKADPDGEAQVVSRQFRRLVETMAVALADNVLAWTATADATKTPAAIQAKELAMKQFASFVSDN